MCGICGIRRFGNAPITQDQICLLLLSNEHRGNDATGIALQQPDGEIHVWKNNTPAFSFVSAPEFNSFLGKYLKEDTMTFLGHTRAATLGSPTDPRNNHPVWAGKSAVVHNGVVSNHHTLFNKFEMPRIGEVDSDVFRGILDKHGITKAAIKALQSVEGSAAIAGIHVDYPGKIILGRCGSPLILGTTPDQLCWSSEKNAIHRAMRPIVKRFGFSMQPNRADLAFITMNDDSIYILGDQVLDWHDTFETSHYYNKPRYRVNETFSGKHKENEGLTAAYCETCKKWREIDDKNKNVPLWKMYCNTCKKYFIDKPEGVEDTPTKRRA